MADYYAKLRLLGHLHELLDLNGESDTVPQRAGNDSLLNQLRSRFSVN